MNQKYKFGLALSGGGLRGIAHIGVIKALIEHGLEPDAIIGTSAGAIAGALYAEGLSAEEMMDFVTSWNYLRTVRPGLPVDGLSSLKFLKEHLLKTIPHDSFGLLQKTFYAGVTNLNAGELEVLSSGSLSDAVMASSSIPLVFKPVEIRGNIYVDGGLISNLAVEPLRSQCEKMIAVNVIAPGEVPSKSLTNIINIGTRVFAVSIAANVKAYAAQCDLVLEPEVGGYQLFKILYKDFSDIYQAGYDCAVAKLDEIKAILAQ